MADSKSPKTSLTKTNPFTVDFKGEEATGMPSISRLLDRKKMPLDPNGQGKTRISSPVSPAASDPVLELRPEVVKTEVKEPGRSGLGFKEINLAEVSSIAIQLDGVAPPTEPNDVYVAHVDSKTSEPESSELSSSSSSPEPELIIIDTEPDPGRTQFVPPPATPPPSSAPKRTSPPSSAPKAPAPPAARTPAPSMEATQVLRSPSAKTSGFEALPVKPAQKRRVPKLSIKVQDKASLMSASDPLAMALKKFFDNGAISVLVLQATATEAVAVLAFEAGARKASWEGLKWNVKLTSPALWTEIQKSGILEIPPMLPALPSGGAKGSMPANPRSVLRRGLGTERSEWLTLLAMESKSLGKAVLAVFSKSSLQTMLPQVKPWLKPSGGAPAKNAA